MTLEHTEIDGKKVYVVEEDVPAKILGYAVWFTFSRIRAPKDIVIEAFKKRLPEYCPPPPTPEDTFKRVCTEFKETTEKIDDLEVAYMIRKISEYERKITIEIKEGRELKYKGAGDLWFNKDTKQIEYNVNGLARNVVTKIVEVFEKEKDCYTEEHLRKILLRILDDIGKLPLKPSGGVYFVPSEDFEKIKHFSEIIKEIKEKVDPKNRTQLWYTPVVDEESFREMLAVRIIDTIDEIVNSAIERLTKLDKEDVPEHIMENRVQKIKISLNSARRMLEKYKKLLQRNIEEADNKIRELEKLLSRMDKAS